MLKIFRTLAIASVMAFSATSCSDDDTLTPLDKTDMTVGDATYSTLTFEWQPVDGARQYSYQFGLPGAEDFIDMGLTKETKLTFTGLQPDTEYQLTVLAYAAMGSGNTTSEPIILTARTSALTSLATPVLEWTREVNSVIVSWQPIDGARDYAYSFTAADGTVIGSGTTYGTSVSFSNVDTGVYTITVTAQTQQDGFGNSAPATLSIDFVRERQELWRTTGVYTSAILGSEWNATLVAYDDNTYTLLSWYGTDGYNLDFTIDESDAANMFHPADSYTSAGGIYTVPTGRTDFPTVNLIATDNRCSLGGNSGKGSITLAVASADKEGNDKFVWGLSFEDLLGTWQLDFDALDYSDSSYDEFYDAEVQITRGTAENTLVLPLPMYYGYTMGSSTITVDMENMTFTMQPYSFGDGIFILAGRASETTPLTGTVSASRIAFDNVQTWYSGYSYLSPDATLVYTRN